jgi:hypothetical protein
MRDLPKRLAVGALLGSLALAAGVSVWLVSRSHTRFPQAPHLTPDTVAAKEAVTDPLLSELLADDYADAEELEYYDRAAVRQALLAEQQRATGKRAVAVAYLLAALEENYAHNRGIVLQAFEARLADPTEMTTRSSMSFRSAVAATQPCGSPCWQPCGGALANRQSCWERSTPTSSPLTSMAFWSVSAISLPKTSGALPT